MAEAGAPLLDPQWLVHRYDPAGDRFHLMKVPRRLHRSSPFLTDEYLSGTDTPLVVGRSEAVATAAPAGPLHYLFHSAFCCSTLLVRALDREAVAMGLSEPVVLNDIVGWRHRGPVDGPKVAMVLDQSLGLLARPWGPGEAVVIKPSNLVNILAPAMLGMRPDTQALLLHAPLEDFLASIARKGLWGRLWVRDLLLKLRREGLLDFGLTGDALLQLTDLQVAALCWLGQHRQFAALVERFGPTRVRTLDSKELMTRPQECLTRLAGLFTLPLSHTAIAEIAGGPAFTRHSKSGEAFSAAEREAERARGLAAHADEVSKVRAWADELARQQNIAVELPAPLLG